MAKKTQAAVLYDLKKPLRLVDLTIPELKSGQVLVDVAFAGVCHTQLLEARGLRGQDKFLPHALGHEVPVSTGGRRGRHESKAWRPRGADLD
jgi:D-arabinose 1-dehydrogenase-like Zn-dependent alcohol dehydrogenase